MSTINYTDEIFATVSQRGTMLASMRLSGITSLADVVRRVRESVGGVAGMTTISLRNCSQGWCHRTAVMFSA